MISFIIPTLNEDSVLEKTIKNLRRLTIVPMEIIVSDGRSTDRTQEIARQYADRLEIYAGSERQTIANGRNLGARAAKGEFLVFHDADVVILDPDAFFTRALEIFKADPKLAAITVPQRVQKEIATRADRVIYSIVNSIHRASNNLFRLGSSGGEFQMIKKEAFEILGGYNEQLVTFEDNDMFRRLAKRFKTRFAPDLPVYHPGRRSRKLGWPRLLGQWILNALSAMIFKKAITKEWKPIR